MSNQRYPEEFKIEAVKHITEFGLRNAVAKSFFQWLKRERIRRKIYGTREEARSDVFDYIESFL
ncbi:Integrase core domain-containing protein [Aquipseudomonas alcaligenes]|uniref:Integrase core domain-containing protein n=1 Tax=Aquipseudomonas alcaligenes TaxID=43263 RepID=A0A1N6V293_AQUAC|nr:Integrase core domain-containing protein [Pseudomonas alcaligenes]